MPTIQVRDGARLHVRVVGRGEPVVLLHGFGSHSGHWLPYALPLAHKYRFILPDMRGFGRSHRVNLNQSCLLTNYSEDLDDILDALEVDQVALGGISMGAYTSLQYHRLTGFKRVSRYLHIDQSPCALNDADWSHGLFGPNQGDEFASFKQLLADIDAYPRGTPFMALPAALRTRLIRGMAGFFCYAFHRNSHKFVVNSIARLESLMTRMLPMENWWAYMDVLRAYLNQDYDMRDSLAEIPVPVTVMVGLHSRMYPAQGQMLVHERVPQSTLVEFKRSGHAPIVDEPLKFLRELRNFLAATPEPALAMA
ncbi:MAG: alpha/beta fold hydrolase [Nevskiales bacterium]